MAYVCTKHEAGSCLLDVRTYNDPSVVGFTPESNFLHNETAVNTEAEGAQNSLSLIQKLAASASTSTHDLHTYGCYNNICVPHVPVVCSTTVAESRAPPLSVYA